MSLAQAILPDGSLSADWVLVIVTSILGTIITGIVVWGINMLSNILKDLKIKVETHDRILADHDILHVKIQEQLNSNIQMNALLNKNQNENLDKIWSKLEKITL